MLVGDRMTPTVITTTRAAPITGALDLLREWRIRRLPVVEQGRVIGIVTRTDLVQAHPSPEAAPGRPAVPARRGWSVGDVMTPDPKVIAPEAPLEDAAALMRDLKIGGVPVVRDGVLVGIITESDLLETLVNLLGARLPSYRITIDMDDRADTVPEIVAVVGTLGFRLYSLTTYPGKAGRLRAVLRIDRAMPLVSLAARLSERGLHVVHAADTPGPEPARTLSVACVECDGGLTPADGGR